MTHFNAQNDFTIYVPSLHEKTRQGQVFWVFRNLDLGFIKEITLKQHSNEEGKKWQSATVKLNLNTNWQQPGISQEVSDNRRRAGALRQRLEEKDAYLKVEYNPEAKPNAKGELPYWTLKKWVPAPVVTVEEKKPEGPKPVLKGLETTPVPANPNSFAVLAEEDGTTTPPGTPMAEEEEA